MESTFVMSVKGAIMEDLFAQSTDFSVRLFTNKSIGEDETFNPQKSYSYYIKLRHPEGTKGSQLFKDAVKKEEKNWGFIVLSVLLTSYQPTFHEDDKLMFFKKSKDAQKAIRECVSEVAQEVKAGNMAEKYSLNDYKVVPAKLYDEVITCEVDGVSYSMNRTDDDFVPTSEFKKAEPGFVELMGIRYPKRTITNPFEYEAEVSVDALNEILMKGWETTEHRYADEQLSYFVPEEIITQSAEDIYQYVIDNIDPEFATLVV